MIEFVFTLDYEIHGNGAGGLKELVYEPANRLREIFHNQNACFVTFVEVAELERIETYGSDPAIGLVREQIRDLSREGFEIALHLHPQWCNARYDGKRWFLDYSEYNLCTLSRTRIAEIVDRSLDYMKYAVDRRDFVPISFRAGNWLFQPTQLAASVLAERGVRIDSSVFKGGLLHNHDLDYRPSVKNGYYWNFSSDVNQPDPTGSWIEIPIYTEMVPFWKMATTKRLGFNSGFGMAGNNTSQKWSRLQDLLRFRYPLKLDFCRMTLSELTCMVGKVIREDQREPELYRPLVAIGHTKDLVDLQTVDAFLTYLRANKITVSTFETVHSRLFRELLAGN